ncbi:MAG: DUF222 domain-containing protein [bacterium]|nr:DUF222 domain-containing protein [bacterium]
MFDATEWEAAIASSDPIARIRADLAEVSMVELDGSAGDSLSTRLVDLLELRERLEAELARVSSQWEKRRAWEADGSLSPVAWLTHRAPLAAPDTRQLVKIAKVINEAPQLAEALHAGDTTAGHVAALARVMSPRRRALLAEHEDVLTKQARRLTVKDFVLLARRWAALADDHIAGDDHDEHQPHNEVHAAVTMDGWLDGKFRLNPIAGAQLLGAFDHLAPPDAVDSPDGVRSLSERRGDALADLANWYHEGAKPGANPPSLNAVVDVATLNGDPPDLAQGRCELAGVGPITQATLAQIACGATLTRLVMAGESLILDMGRKVRLATPAQARAIRIRDTGCIFPSCDRPAHWCDIHHVDEWADGGLTDVARMVCLCRRHHTLIHNSKWTITINPDGSFQMTHPARAP